MHDLSIGALRAGFSAGSFTPRDAIEAVLTRIAAWQAATPPLGGLWHLEPEMARQEADLATKRWRDNRPIGALEGIPATVKELIATQGVAVPQGSAATTLVPARADSPVAARLREAGALIFARTTVPDIGMLSSGVSSFHELTRNPWNLAANPGGSSAGAAAAAAAGYGPVHIGTDIGGSVRLPAAWTGLVGFKPSQGRIPIDPYYLGRCAGPMARCVEDAAEIMAVITRPDRRDATSLPYQAIDWAQPITSVAGLRIGVMMEAGCGMALEAPVAEAVERAARLFEAHGARLVPVGPILDRSLLHGCDVFWRARAWGELSRLSPEARARVLPAILAWARTGADVSGVEAVRGMSGSFTLRQRGAALFDGLDAVISPVTPNVSFPAEWSSPLDDPANRPFEHIAYTLPWNFTEQPAICLNAGFGPGFDGRTMPIGVQIVTDRFEDLKAMQLARWFERHGDAAVTSWPEPGM
ncbi:amidase [Asaia sp. VD9]|uniref:amidase n=1 Tax=Asaia sp. VD9 TaxID=3081235 RepID=UPI00301992F6